MLLLLLQKAEPKPKPAAKKEAVKEEPKSAEPANKQPVKKVVKKEEGEQKDKDKPARVKKEFDMPGQTRETPLEVCNCACMHRCHPRLLAP